MPHSFYMPVKIISGENCVMQSAGEFKKLGNKAYIVTSPSSSRNGALADVTAALESQGIAYGIFDRCENNPSIARTNEMAPRCLPAGAISSSASAAARPWTLPRRPAFWPSTG